MTVRSTADIKLYRTVHNSILTHHHKGAEAMHLHLHIYLLLNAYNRILIRHFSQTLSFTTFAYCFHSIIGSQYRVWNFTLFSNFCDFPEEHVLKTNMLIPFLFHFKSSHNFKQQPLRLCHCASEIIRMMFNNLKSGSPDNLTLRIISDFNQ